MGIEEKLGNSGAVCGGDKQNHWQNVCLRGGWQAPFEEHFEISGCKIVQFPSIYSILVFSSKNSQNCRSCPASEVHTHGNGCVRDCQMAHDGSIFLDCHHSVYKDSQSEPAKHTAVDIDVISAHSTHLPTPAARPIIFLNRFPQIVRITFAVGKSKNSADLWKIIIPVYIPFLEIFSFLHNFYCDISVNIWHTMCSLPHRNCAKPNIFQIVSHAISFQCFFKNPFIMDEYHTQNVRMLSDTLCTKLFYGLSRV